MPISFQGSQDGTDLERESACEWIISRAPLNLSNLEVADIRNGSHKKLLELFFVAIFPAMIRMSLLVGGWACSSNGGSPGSCPLRLMRVLERRMSSLRIAEQRSISSDSWIEDMLYCPSKVVV